MQIEEEIRVSDESKLRALAAEVPSSIEEEMSYLEQTLYPLKVTIEYLDEETRFLDQARQFLKENYAYYPLEQFNLVFEAVGLKDTAGQILTINFSAIFVGLPLNIIPAGAPRLWYHLLLSIYLTSWVFQVNKLIYMMSIALFNYLLLPFSLQKRFNPFYILFFNIFILCITNLYYEVFFDPPFGFFYNILEMVTVVKVMNLNFQLSNGKFLTEEEIEKYCKSDPKLGSKRELYNNKVFIIPTLFEYINFILGLFFNGLGFPCNYRHFYDWAYGKYYSNEWMEERKYPVDEEKFKAVVKQWESERMRIVAGKIVEFAIFTFCAIYLVNNLDLNSWEYYYNQGMLQVYAYGLIYSFKIFSEFLTAYALFSILWLSSGYGFKYDENYQLRIYESIGIFNYQFLVEPYFRNSLAILWNTPIAYNQCFYLYFQSILNKMSRNTAFYMNMIMTGLWHGVTGSWMFIFILAGVLSKSSTAIYKNDQKILGYLREKKKLAGGMYTVYFWIVYLWTMFIGMLGNLAVYMTGNIMRNSTIEKLYYYMIYTYYSPIVTVFGLYFYSQIYTVVTNGMKFLNKVKDY